MTIVKKILLLVVISSWLSANLMLANPVEFVGDVVINEGMQQNIKSDADKQKAFNEYLVEQIFLKDMFNNKNSIFKPEPDETALFNNNTHALYSDYTKKEIARQIVENGLIKDLAIEQQVGSM